jgi:hypothetical protein
LIQIKQILQLKLNYYTIYVHCTIYSIRQEDIDETRVVSH